MRRVCHGTYTVVYHTYNDNVASGMARCYFQWYGYEPMDLDETDEVTITLLITDNCARHGDFVGTE